ncbi:LysR family transcriptional regulator [Martelella alba]|uniref:LysR family transcriptional regulator n=1 Tax=Martelella alba TaxID=2590451 RepID=A0ABY2SEA3_9HYPH|nr:LysR family transcriptional regulator [Martelella alba]TKI03059.1 LysR family transcriptional regulator [Martelella alba]
MFELGQLRCFIVVANELSFRRAAHKLNMTQPPLTRQIQVLEHQIGVRLFDRSTRSVTLTVAGQAFLREAIHVIEQADFAVQTVKQIAFGEMGNISISFVASAVYDFLPKVIQSVKERYPHIVFNLKEMPTPAQINGLQLHRMDLGIVRDPPFIEDFVSELLVSEPFILAIPASHPLAEVEDLSATSLTHYGLITYSSSGWRPFHDMIAIALRRNKIRPKIVYSFETSVTILAMVNSGLGIALVPACSRIVSFPNIIFREFDLDPELRSNLYLLWRKDNNNPVLPTILDSLRLKARPSYARE